MKKFIVILLSNFIFTISFAQTDAAYRIFGEIMTVENKVYKGFITWNGNKNYWIDFFEASKIENPYRSYFKRSDGLVFRANDREFITPPTHNFCCRFGNIKSIRPTDVNEIVLQLKNGDRLTLVKGYSSDINTHIRITTPTETTSIKWDHISEIHFMGADKEAIAPETNQVAGTVKSTQGIYKGIIYWNSQQRQSQEKMNQINISLNKIKKLYAFKGKNGNHTFGLIPLVSPNDDPADAQINALYPVENITINMPNIGSVCVSRAQFEELTIIPISELNLLSYDDFPSPQAIKGEVVTRSGQTFAGNLAYDLDESYEFEVLDGKNNTISYRIPFRYIRSIAPKNYKYSFITLRNNSQLSLGETCDVNQDNNGIIIFRNGQNPVYILWSEIKEINLK